MFFWKDLQIAQRLHNNEVTQKQSYIYFSIFAVFVLAWIYSNSLNILDFINHNNTQKLITVSTSIFFYVSIYCTCFYINKKGDNKNFLKRMATLACPVEIKSGLIFGTLMGITMWVEILWPVINGSQSLSFYWQEYVAKENFPPLHATYIIWLISYIYTFWRYVLAFQISSDISPNKEQQPLTA